ncbi:MAG: ATP-binding protein [Thermodesulfobacteriota bacterium]
MASNTDRHAVDPDKLRWRLDPASLPFATTAELEPLTGLIGQDRGVEAFRFGMGMDREGYNIFVTGPNDTGRLANVRRLLEDLTRKEQVPDDLCYVNNFKNPESPMLLRFPAGQGQAFRKDVNTLLDHLKAEVPQLFESQDFMARKNEIMEAYERQSREFFKELNKKVKDTGFALVNVQMGNVQRPELMPIVDGEPKPLMQLEDLVEKGRFPAEEYEQLKTTYAVLKKEIDEIFLQLRDLQKEVKEKSREIDKIMFRTLAEDALTPVRKRFSGDKVAKYLDGMVGDMAENHEVFLQSREAQGPPGTVPDFFSPYRVNLLVDNSELTASPVVIENHPTYRNIFGSVERVYDRSGVWRTDFSKIVAGSLLRANGGYLVLNLMDAVIEPGVWPALKRSLKSTKMEIQTYDPFYFFSSSGLKPEPIELDVKVVVLSDERLYHLLRHYDEDVPRIFKVRADFGLTMDRTEAAVLDFARFIKRECDQNGLRPFCREAVAALVEEAVRLAGRTEKLSTAFPVLADLIMEADYYANRDGADTVAAGHVDRAVETRILRSNRVEELIQEMISRGTLQIDVDGAVVGQVNGLSVYSLGDVAFGKPSRITAATSMGKDGVINIEREAELSGAIHNKGVLILSGYLRRMYAQDKPLALAASIAFEQSYGGVDGDSASSTELYALLSSLSGLPLRQDIAVTGSVNQKGEVQAIGGVNHKVEGFYDTCKALGLTGRQGVMIPAANVPDLMLRKDVAEAIAQGRFHLWAVRTVDQGIEILTGRPAGEPGKDGAFPENSVAALVDARLADLAKGLKEFGEEAGKKGRKRPAGKKK